MNELIRVLKKEMEALGLPWYEDRPIFLVQNDKNIIHFTVDPSEMDDMICRRCGGSLEWELVPDPDSLCYFSKHKDCGLEYQLIPINYRLDTIELEKKIEDN